MSGPDLVDLYTRAAAVFGEVVSELTDEEWDVATWPEGWTVVSTVAWVVVGDSQVPLAIAGGELDPPRDFDAGVLGANPVATWRGTALAAVAALRAPGALEQRIALVDGELVVADLVGQRVTENVVRAHDIARAVGREAALHDPLVLELADWCLEFWAGHADAVRSGSVLPARPVQPAPGSDALDRLVALAGRDMNHDA